ncbi:MAG: hypothetical protein L0Y39_12110 [Methylococcaceae bacterium]|nr:hypothetical protein [Methylococcaceae bacterium]
MNPNDLIGNLVLVGSVILTAIVVIWLPILRRRELAQVAERKGKPIFVELHGSSQFNADGTARSEAVHDLTHETQLVLKRKIIPQSEEANVEVFTAQDHSLGLLPETIGRELAKELAAGKKIEVKIDLVTGGTEQHPDYYIKLVLRRQSLITGRRR